jgi:hypothetical protein
MRVLLALMAAILVGLAAGPASTQPAATPVPADSAVSGLRPAPVFASIERAWVIGNVDSVLGHFGSRKVAISLPGGPQDGTFSRAQSYFILKDLFDATRTEEFSFVSIRQPEGQPHTALGSAERLFRRKDSSRLLQDRIFVLLALEEGRWVVVEIKSVR